MIHTKSGDGMHYLNCFFVYSILGHILESIVAIIFKTNFKSGFLYGWWTPVYGVGAVIILFVSEYLFKNLHMHRFWETIIMFFALAIVLSTIEALGGVLIEKIFGEIFWNYSNQRFNIGRYISLEMTLIWGITSIIFVYVIHPLLIGLIKKIPSYITIFLVMLFLFDITKTIVKKGKI